MEKARVEIEFEDGTIAIWGSVDEDIAERIEEILGQPDTLHC